MIPIKLEILKKRLKRCNCYPERKTAPHCLFCWKEYKHNRICLICVAWGTLPADKLSWNFGIISPVDILFEGEDE